MIIVSQDKDKIVNFNNLTQLYITQDEEKTAYYIRFETVDSSYDDLGEYNTEEKAREILGEIAKVYQFYKGKTYTIGDYNSLWGTYEYGVYQMSERR